MVRCKAREIMRNEAGLLSAAVTKDACNAADGRFSAASLKEKRTWVQSTHFL